MESFRLVTVHPALVHLTVGVLPFLTLAYGVAAWRKSERWTFAGDALLMFTAVTTLVVSLFGLLAFLALSWPEGLDFWRWLHLGMGVASTVLIAGFATARVRARRRRATVAQGRTLGFSVFLLATVGFTGWVGGEVLVYHAGMAVKAAANGALAPPTDRAIEEEPDSLQEAMGRIRARWASATTHRATMLVERPSPAAFARVAEDAGEIQALAGWVAEEGAAMHVRYEDGRGDGHEDVGYAQSDETVADLTSMARMLEARATSLAQEARARDLRGVIATTAEMERVCAGCHLQFRW